MVLFRSTAFNNRYPEDVKMVMPLSGITGMINQIKDVSFYVLLIYTSISSGLNLLNNQSINKIMSRKSNQLCQ